MITDTRNHRVQVFTNTGELVRVIGRRGFGPGEFTKPIGLGASIGKSTYTYG